MTADSSVSDATRDVLVNMLRELRADYGDHGFIMEKTALDFAISELTTPRPDGQAVAEMVEVPDGLGTVFCKFYSGKRPPAGTKLYTTPERPESDGETIVIDGKRYALDTVRTALLGLARDFIAATAQGEGKGHG